MNGLGRVDRRRRRIRAALAVPVLLLLGVPIAGLFPVAEAAPTPAPLPGSRNRPLAPLRDALVLRGDEIGLGRRPSTRQKRLLARALDRMDRAGPALLDDLRVAVPVFRLLDEAFPGDPVLEPPGNAALEALRQEVHGEQPGLLAWTARVRTARDRVLLERRAARMFGLMALYESETRRPVRARLLLAACRIVDGVRRGIDLLPPRIDPPPFQGTAPDFLLVDANPASGTAGRAVSPRDLQGKVVACFFMAST